MDNKDNNISAEFNYTVNESDYRKAVFFNIFCKNIAVFIIISVFFTYSVIIQLLKIFNLYEPSLNADKGSIIYILVVLLLLIVTEMLSRKYIKAGSASSFGKTIYGLVDNSGIITSFSKDGEKFLYDWGSFERAFEIKNYFIFFMSRQSILIIPKLEIDEETQKVIRDYAISYLQMRYRRRRWM